MRHVELVAFENDSILHQKALSLPIGKVSLRQLGVLVIGILSVFAAYAITDNFWVAAIIFAIFLGIGMPNTKIMTPDQMIKSVILFLIRGTSLSKKPEYLQTRSKQKEKKNNASVSATETQTNNNVMSKILSQIESFYKKKETKEKKMMSNENKNYSIKIQLTPENMLSITPIRIKKKNQESSNSIDKLLSSWTTLKNDLPNQNSGFLQEHVSVLLDGKKLESNKIISKNNSVSVLLDKNSRYDIKTTVDEYLKK